MTAMYVAVGVVVRKKTRTRRPSSRKIGTERTAQMMSKSARVLAALRAPHFFGRLREFRSPNKHLRKDLHDGNFSTTPIRLEKKSDSKRMKSDDRRMNDDGRRTVRSQNDDDRRTVRRQKGERKSDGKRMNGGDRRTNDDDKRTETRRRGVIRKFASLNK
ncbi:hypothetical protein NQ318_004149 [Aromia moschata]|uniref:Uncharacterized protein n=1 Tax=Aromia moschata TaxID=1265417 RepID=A0AAV8YP07_9CUCU|nr:hypothetical protein NQ318_004149 [Aromia moschata]